MWTIELLEAELEGCDRVLRFNKNNHQQHFFKANHLTELGRLKNDPSYYKKSLESYEVAINLSKGEIPIYFAKRASLYVTMGNTKEAVLDMAIVAKFPRSNLYKKDINDIFADQTLDDIAELDVVKDDVKKLVAKNEITLEIASVLNRHLEITNKLVVEVGVHSKKLHEHDNIFQEHNVQLQEHLDIIKKQANDIEYLKKELAKDKQQNSKLQKVFIEPVENKVIDVQTLLINDVEHIKKELIKIKAQTPELVTKIEAEIKIIQTKLEEHQEIIEDSKLLEAVRVRKAFEQLEAEQSHQELYLYCKTFYWTMLDLFCAYRSLSTGVIKGSFYNDTSTVEKVLEETIVRGVSYGATFTQAIPFVGGAIAMVDDIITKTYETIKTRELKQKANIISKIIRNSFPFDEDISVGVAEAAYSAMEMRKQKILTPEILNIGKIRSAFNWLHDKCISVKKTIFPYEILNDVGNLAVCLALEDVALTITSFLINHELILNRKSILKEELKWVIQEDKLKQQLAGKSEVEVLDKIALENKKVEELKYFTLIENKMGTEKLDLLHLKAGKGKWISKSLLNDCVKDFLKESYILKIIGNTVENTKNTQNFKKFIFKHICKGIDEYQGTVKHYNCIKKFIKNNKELTKQITQDYPEFFINESIVKACKFDLVFENQIINALNAISEKINPVILGQEANIY